jgi:hypothetical protein
MIKSQKSKRSKAKNARMTLDNYRTLMTAAIAENLLRTVANKPKAKTGNTKTSALDFTEDYLQYLTTDQDKLRREIRNIQSKKSIEKAKPDFDETSDRWQQLLSIEEILKSIRVDIEPVARPKKVDERLTKIAELLDKNIDILKAAESKELLKQIAVVLAPAEPEQVPEAEVVTEETTGDAE